MKSTLYRYERKWVCNSKNKLDLIIALSRSNLFFTYQYPNRKVHSIYFDDEKHSSIIENLDGVSIKNKIRLRWYGKINFIENPILEIKHKKAFENKKILIEVKNINNLKLNDHKNLNLIKKVVNSKVNSKKILSPILTTNYERQYFISSNGLIRATLDYDLKSIYLKNYSQIDIIKYFNNHCILEIKYPTNLDKYVRDNLKDISLRLSKNSKFVNSAVNIPSYYY